MPVAVDDNNNKNGHTAQLPPSLTITPLSLIFNLVSALNPSHSTILTGEVKRWNREQGMADSPKSGKEEGRKRETLSHGTESLRSGQTCQLTLCEDLCSTW